jgi:tRNA G18 (ribose-2'-O)-methylase SpoU
MDDLGRMSAEEASQAPKHSIIIILDEVRSMHNVGSVFRTCDAFAIQSLYLCGYTPTPPHRDIQKTALGATETVAWQHFPTTLDAVEHAAQLGYKIVAVEQVHNSQMLHQNSLQNEKIALVFGNEVTGVQDDILAKAEACLEIPQWGSKHSLNISVSVGIVLWELVRSSNLAQAK